MTTESDLILWINSLFIAIFIKSHYSHFAMCQICWLLTKKLLLYYQKERSHHEEDLWSVWEPSLFRNKKGSRMGNGPGVECADGNSFRGHPTCIMGDGVGVFRLPFYGLGSGIFRLFHPRRYRGMEEVAQKMSKRRKAPRGSTPPVAFFLSLSQALAMKSLVNFS